MRNILILVALVFAFSGCEESKKIVPSSKIVNIGVLAPLSGNHKTLGEQGIVGLNAAQEMSKYLLNGDEIVFKIVDTKSSVADSRKAFRELVDANVSALISFMGSGRTLALKNDFNKGKIRLIATLATDDNITSINGSISQIPSYEKNTRNFQ